VIPVEFLSKIAETTHQQQKGIDMVIKGHLGVIRTMV
jgi:hypothetical protein